MNKMEKLMEILKETDLSITDKYDLKKLLSIFVNNQFELIIKIIQTKGLDITIKEFIKNNILSIFDEIQETHEELINCMTKKTNNENFNDVIYNTLLEEIDILHFIIQHYILLSIIKRLQNNQVSINNIVNLLKDKEFRNQVINDIYNYFIDELKERMVSENINNSFFNKFLMYSNKSYYTLTIVGLITYKQVLELEIFSTPKSVEDIICDMNIYLSHLLKLISWKHWKKYSPSYDEDNIPQSFNVLTKIFLELYYLFIRTVSLLNKSNQPTIQDYKKLHEMLFSDSDNKQYVMVMMVILYLYKNIENFNRQDNDY